MHHDGVDEFKDGLIGKFADLGVVTAAKLRAKREKSEIIEKVEREPLGTDFVEQFGSALRECVAKVINLADDPRRKPAFLFHGYETTELSLIEELLLAEAEQEPVVAEQARICGKNARHWEQKLSADTEAGELFQVTRRRERVEFDEV
jgi:hypothetical protein